MADEEKKYFKKLTFSNGTEAYVKDDEARNGISILQGQISALQNANFDFSTDISDLQTSVGAISRSIQAIDISTAVAIGSSHVDSLDDILLYALNTIDIMPKQATITIEQENKKVADGLHLTFSQNDIKIINNEIEENSVVENDIINLSAEDIKLYNIDSLSKINVATSNNQIIDIFFGDGLKDKYILSATPILNDADKPIKVYLDGIQKTSGYILSNDKITFSDTPYPFGHIKVTYFTNDKKYNYSISDAQQSTNGVESLAIGKNSISNGNYSIAAGQNTSASGVGSVALGYNTIASSDFQQVFGRNNEEDDQNQYIEIVGNGGKYTQDIKNETITVLTKDNNSNSYYIELQESNIININSVNLDKTDYALDEDDFIKAATFVKNTIHDEAAQIYIYTKDEIPENYRIPISFTINYQIGSSAETSINVSSALLQDDNTNPNSVAGYEGYACRLIEYTFDNTTDDITLKRISNIKTNFTSTELNYTWPVNNNGKNRIEIKNDIINTYFRILHPEIIVNYTYNNSISNNGVPRSNARTLDWDGNECIAGNLTVGGSLSFKSGIKFYSTDSTHDQLKAKQEFTIFNSTILSSGVYIVKGSMSVTTSTNAQTYTLKVFTTNTQEVESISINSTKNAKGILKTWFYLPNDDYINLSITPGGTNTVTFSNDDNYLQIIKIA